VPATQLKHFDVSRQLTQGEVQFWQISDGSEYVPSAQIVRHVNVDGLKYIKLFGVGKQFKHLVLSKLHALQGDVQ
jgi:hypothetical protein